MLSSEFTSQTPHRTLRLRVSHQNSEAAKPHLVHCRGARGPESLPSCCYGPMHAGMPTQVSQHVLGLPGLPPVTNKAQAMCDTGHVSVTMLQNTQKGGGGGGGHCMVTKATMPTV